MDNDQHLYLLNSTSKTKGIREMYFKMSEHFQRSYFRFVTLKHHYILPSTQLECKTLAKAFEYLSKMKI